VGHSAPLFWSSWNTDIDEEDADIVVERPASIEDPKVIKKNNICPYLAYLFHNIADNFLTILTYVHIWHIYSTILLTTFANQQVYCV
jgi:hypothetical protein